MHGEPQGGGKLDCSGVFGRCRPARDDPRETWKALELGARVGGLVAPRCGAMGAGGGWEGVARVVGCSGMP